MSLITSASNSVALAALEYLQLTGMQSNNVLTDVLNHSMCNSALKDNFSLCTTLTVQGCETGQTPPCSPARTEQAHGQHTTSSCQSLQFVKLGGFTTQSCLPRIAATSTEQPNIVEQLWGCGVLTLLNFLMPP